MPIDKEKVFDALAIRDTNEKTSSISLLKDLIKKL